MSFEGGAEAEVEHYRRAWRQLALLQITRFTGFLAWMVVGAALVISVPGSGVARWLATVLNPAWTTTIVGLTWGVVFMAISAATGSDFRCPRCQQRFGINLDFQHGRIPKTCISCGLPRGATGPDAVEMPPPTSDPDPVHGHPWAIGLVLIGMGVVIVYLGVQVLLHFNDLPEAGIPVFLFLWLLGDTFVLIGYRLCRGYWRKANTKGCV